MTAHLEPTVSDRNLRYFPPIPATDGFVEVHDSSLADSPHVWLKVTQGPGGVCQFAQLSAPNAVLLAEQLLALAGGNGREGDG